MKKLFYFLLLLSTLVGTEGTATCYLCANGCKGGNCCTLPSAEDPNCLVCGYYGCARCANGFRLTNGTFAVCSPACKQKEGEKCYPGRCIKKRKCERPFKCLKNKNQTCG